MPEHDPLRVRQVFLEVADLPPAQRGPALERACAGDAALRAEVEALLAAHEQAGAFLSSPTSFPAGTTAPGGRERPGTGTATLPLTGASGGIPGFPTTPDRIGEFRILNRLGEGGMGVVYLAEDTILGRKVALKVLASHLTGSEAALGRFRQEAKSAAALKHPAIVPVFKFDFDGRSHYIASEFVDGPTLGDVIAGELERRRTDRGRGVREWLHRSAEVAAVIADALDCSHRAGIVHRDVKPSNILIDRTLGPRLTDFGIAKHLTEEPRTKPTEQFGTCHYMSPEQAAVAGARVDQRSDVFSLGVVLYEMLTLRRPFEGSDIPQVLSAIVSLDPPHARSVEPAVPRDLAVICHKALEKDPARRYQTAAHMAADLRCFLEGRPILAQPPGPARRAAQWSRRHRRLFGVVAAILLIAAAAWSILAVLAQRDARLAWVLLDTGGAACRVMMQEHDPSLLRPGPRRDIGPGSTQRTLKVPPGQYRLTVQRDSDGAFCEFNLVLIETGSSHLRRVRALDASEGVNYHPSAGEMIGILAGDGEPGAQEMVRVEGGSYNLRRPETPDQLLANAVLTAFLIDRTEVSNRQYKAFVDATGRSPPAYWSESPGWETLADKPVVMVSMEDAEAYARWRGKRLPTLIEWQAAARGTAGDLFPGGDTAPVVDPPWSADPRAARYPAQIAAYIERTGAVGQPDAWDPPSKPIRMFSNVRELTGTVRPSSLSVYLAGRGWADDPATEDLSRTLTGPIGDFRSMHAGFRCARSIITKE